MVIFQGVLMRVDRIEVAFMFFRYLTVLPIFNKTVINPLKYAHPSGT
jgi:hypothetical protein